MVDEESCSSVGRKLIREEENQKHLPHYPLQNIVFYTQIPFLKNMVMSREFEFLLADLGLHFVFSQYLKEAVGECCSIASWKEAGLARAHHSQLQNGMLPVQDIKR